MELVFATNNAHKLDEVRAILGDRIQVLSLVDIGFTDDLPETSGTIPGNALQKATRVFELTGMACFADDSGLEVQALDGRPGVDSAFYAGPQRNAKDNMDRVLVELEDKPDRSARFITVIAYVDQTGEFLFEGDIPGKIGNTASGAGGFGYDPIFIPDGYSLSFAEFAPEEKNRISHRARATALFAEWLRDKRSF